MKYWSADILMSHLLYPSYNISTCINPDWLPVWLGFPPQQYCRHTWERRQGKIDGNPSKCCGPQVIDSLIQIYLFWHSIQLLSATKHITMMEDWEYFTERSIFSKERARQYYSTDKVGLFNWHKRRIVWPPPLPGQFRTQHIVVISISIYW